MFVSKSTILIFFDGCIILNRHKLECQDVSFQRQVEYEEQETHPSNLPQWEVVMQDDSESDESKVKCHLFNSQIFFQKSIFPCQAILKVKTEKMMS
jgi:hypothetical protein